MQGECKENAGRLLQLFVVESSKVYQRKGRQSDFPPDDNDDDDDDDKVLFRRGNIKKDEIFWLVQPVCRGCCRSDAETSRRWGCFSRCTSNTHVVADSLTLPSCAKDQSTP